MVPDAFSDAAAELLSGRSEITAHAAGPPFVAQELADRRVRTVLNSYDLLGGPHTFNVLSSTRSFAFAEANPRSFAVVYESLEARSPGSAGTTGRPPRPTSG